MARFLENPDFVQACREDKRKVDLRVWIDWFGDGQLDEIENADDEILKLNISRELEGDVSQAILDQGTLVLDNSNNDYSPKSLASRFNVDLGSEFEFNLIPNRSVMIDLSVNGSDYVHYYSGIITNIEPNYDNSRVSLTIEDEMIALDNVSAPDKLFIERNAKEVIAELVEETTIDYDPAMVDDIDYQITYNFSQDGSVFNALNLIAEMVWGKFFVIGDTLRFINFKTLDQPSETIVETISDTQFLDSGYGETFSSQDLYTTVELDSDPLQYTSEDLQMIWTGSEKQSRITEEYLGSDLEGDQLQLTHTVEGVIEEPTNNVPIAENSLTVSFGDRTYITDREMTSGIESVNWDTGLITFKNTAEFPAPSTNQTITVNYNFFVLTIPPRRSDGTPYEKEIIAEFEDPATDIQPIEDYIKFQATDLAYDVTYASYRDYIPGFLRGSAGTYQSGTITLSDNAQTIQVTGRLRIKNADYKYFWDRGTEAKNATAEVYIVQNGTRVKKIKSYTTAWNTTRYSSDKIPVNPADNITLEVVFDGTGEKYSEVQLYTATVNVGEEIIDEVTQEIQNVRVEQYDFEDNRKTRLTFINDSDTEVSVYSEYNGKDVDNIYLLGRPLKRTNPKHVEKTNEDANSSFSYMGKTLSLQNDLFQTELRMSQTVDFLLDYYSTPRTILNVPIKGLGHIDLMDKVHITRDESDIDNDFFIKAIEEEFTEDGEWLQTLDLFQSASSTWSYDSEGVNSIIASRESVDTTPSDRPPSVTDLSVEITTVDNEEQSFPALDISFTGNRFARLYTIYLKRGTGSFEEISRISEESYKYGRPLKSGNYTVKVVAESYDGIREEFDTAPEFQFSYGSSDAVDDTSISLTEIKSINKDGTVLSYVLAEWTPPNDNLYGYTSIYRKNVDENTDYKLLTRTTLDYYETDFLSEGTYEFKFVSEDRYGESSDFVTAPTETITVQGQTAPPSNVSIKRSAFNTSIILEWFNNIDSDLQGYEVRTDENFGTDDVNLIYKGDSNRIELDEFPLEGYTGEVRSYTFYIRAFNSSEIYSSLSEEVTVTNTAPTAPTLDVTAFFESLWIKVLPSSESDIEGHQITIEEVGGGTETFNIATGERLTFSGTISTTYNVKARSIDIIGEGAWSSVHTAETKTLDMLSQFSQDLRPPKIVGTLPTLPDSDFPNGSTVVLTTDGKLYRNNGGNWTAEVSTGDLAGEITETQIADNSISTAKLQANAVTANEILAGSITTDEIAANTITSANILAGAIGVDELAAGSITAEKVGTNEIITHSANISDAVIDYLQAIEITADMVTVGSASTFEPGFNPYENNQEAMKVMPQNSLLWHFDRHFTSTQGDKIDFTL